MDEIINKFNNIKITEKSQLVDKYLIPQELEKKKNAEVSTPYKLRQEMIDTIPVEFWSKKQKVFEPCSGKGGFLIDIIDKFLKHSTLSYKEIVEDCLYFSDINPTNIYINKLLLDPENKYKLNYNEGNTLELDIKVKWNLEGFDAVIGNPPYNDDSGNKGSGHKIWDKFVIKSLNEWVKQNGYLLYVHPSGWRQINNKIFKLLNQKQMVYLEIHNIQDGIKTFKCSTRYDWYLLENKSIYKDTIIKDEEGIINYIKLNEWCFIPNMMFNEIKLLLTNDLNNRVKLLHSRSDYGTDKKHISKIFTDVFKYPCIKYVNKGQNLHLVYSNVNNKGHFGEIKFIFSNGVDTFIDRDGKYALSEWSTGIIDDIIILERIKKVFENIKFIKIIKSIQITNIKYNFNIIKLFKKDFYKEFIN